MRSRTIASSFRTPSSASAASTKVEIAAFRRREIRHQALIDAMRIDDDSALRGLSGDLGQAHDRDGTRSNDVGQYLPQPDRRQLIDIAN
jgi:hypothetical protein